MEETSDDLEMMEVGSNRAAEQQQQQRTDGAIWTQRRQVDSKEEDC